ncbi:hypothetical protein SARC_09704 [Sphaeroforma arctica JP610]|uniref:Uncharacterized protein n=1 Tax=Sphaeroforma arctica JP610 TaxID=667725 RepID=A0A0L0FM35_9EUKA|nr:hypothetical protein SARC_09704 [Sphaeroforma arctica JP610]KNC77849.1 hypothetical protein SARC_09704 [Sphaeroforma arctica JP610]|eukprot:XP_014151751.1 hypothetical protein SARC_09704 [Sphaeroforma arctica JP610]
MIGFPRSQIASGKNIHLHPRSPIVSYNTISATQMETPAESPTDLTPIGSPSLSTQHRLSLAALQAHEAHRRRDNASLNHDHIYFGHSVAHYVPVPLADEDRDGDIMEKALPRVA